MVRREIHCLMTQRSPPDPMPPAVPARGVSILISGSGETAMSMLALGFARKVDRAFAWANFSESTRRLNEGVRKMFVERTEGRRVEHASVDGLSTSVEGPRVLRTFLRSDPASEDLESRLEAYLTLPEIFQSLLGRTVSANGEGAMVLTNLDAVPPEVLRKTVELPALHDILHREGVTLLVTYRGSPPSSLDRVFDEVFRVERLGKNWPDALLAATRSEQFPGLRAPRPLRDCWSDLGFSPALLPG